MVFQCFGITLLKNVKETKLMFWPDFFKETMKKQNSA